MNEHIKELEQIFLVVLDYYQFNNYTNIPKKFDKYFKNIKQELERLKELEQIWNKEEWCKGIPLSAESLKSLFNYNEELFEENLKLDKENLILKQSVKDTYDTSQEIIADLKEEIQDLKDNETIVADYGVDLWNENQKLKKALEILKQYISLDLECNIYHEIRMGREMIVIPQPEYELLKEVLYDDKRN